MAPSVLVLVGLPGSGKSTFYAALEALAPSEYVRVCQDVLKTKPKCEKAAKAAIDEGKVAVIDRTNVDAKQREPWVGLASSLGVPVTAVYFDVPPPLCMERVKSRTDHETNPPAFVVNMMKGRLRAPSAAEGFSRVDTVSTPQDVTQLVTRLCGGGGEKPHEPSSTMSTVGVEAQDSGSQSTTHRDEDRGTKRIAASISSSSGSSSTRTTTTTTSAAATTFAPSAKPVRVEGLAVLSIKQPSADLILRCGKDVENRSRGKLSHKQMGVLGQLRGGREIGWGDGKGGKEGEEEGLWVLVHSSQGREKNFCLSEAQIDAVDAWQQDRDGGGKPQGGGGKRGGGKRGVKHGGGGGPATKKGGGSMSSIAARSAAIIDALPQRRGAVIGAMRVVDERQDERVDPSSSSSSFSSSSFSSSSSSPSSSSSGCCGGRGGNSGDNKWVDSVWANVGASHMRIAEVVAFDDNDSACQPLKGEVRLYGIAWEALNDGVVRQLGQRGIAAGSFVQAAISQKKAKEGAKETAKEGTAKEGAKEQKQKTKPKTVPKKKKQKDGLE